MKQIFTLLLVLVASMSFGQRTLSTVRVDTIETNYSGSMSFPKSVQVNCTEVGGTSDGVVRLQGSVDGSTWVNLTSVEGVYDFFPNDTLSISDGASLIVRINDGNSIPFYRVSVTGTVNDTTDVAIAWRKSFIR